MKSNAMLHPTNGRIALSSVGCTIGLAPPTSSPAWGRSEIRTAPGRGARDTVGGLANRPWASNQAHEGQFRRKDCDPLSRRDYSPSHLSACL